MATITLSHNQIHENALKFTSEWQIVLKHSTHGEKQLLSSSWLNFMMFLVYQKKNTV